MRIIFIRHGDPDYSCNSLTDKGKVEAALLAEHIDILKLENSDIYISPFGRARETAQYVLEKLGKQGEIVDWLSEFCAQVDVNGSEALQKAYPNTKIRDGRYAPRVPWDCLPSYWTEHSELFDPEGWKDSEIVRNSEMLERYETVTKSFDALLASYGYVREGRHYRVERENDITITCFSHFGLTCVILGYLWSISPFVLWHSLVMAPSSVTEIWSEEREQGIAYFRASRIGDISHLRMGQEEPSFMARHAELYSHQAATKGTLNLV